MSSLSRRAYGIALVAVAAVLWSTVGLYVRFLDMDVWALLFWRSLFAALALFGTVFVQQGRGGFAAVRAIGGVGLLAAVMSGLSMASYITAVSFTTIANVLTMFGVLPFVAAGFAYFWLGEQPRPRVLVAASIALVGIVIMVGATARPQDIFGILLALSMTVTWAWMVVLSQRYPTLGMAPVNALGALLCAAACLPLMSWTLPSPVQLAVLALFGVATTAIAFMVFLAGARHITASEAGLIGQLDLVLGPLWVWLAFSEDPGVAAIVGGLVVLAAVLWYLSDTRPGPGRPGAEIHEAPYP